MGFRETLNRNRWIVTVVVLIAVGVAIWVIIRQVSTGFGGATSRKVDFYSIDDGKSWFKDASDKLPPFESGGQQAVKAIVYSCNGKEVVGYLERFTPEAKAAIEEGKRMAEQKKQPNIGAMTGALMNGKQIKKPGDRDWQKAMGPEAAKITNLKCEDGSVASIVIP